MKLSSIKKIFQLGALISSIVIGCFWYKSFPTKNQITEDRGDFSMDDWLDKKTANDKKATTEQFSQLVRASKGRPESYTPVNIYKTGIEKFWALKKSINKKEIREEIFESLYQSDHKKYTKLSEQILISNKFAREKFGRDQSIARIFAVEYLIYGMKSGNYDTIESTISRLSKLGFQKNANVKGQHLDFEQLLEGYVRTDPENFLGNYSFLVDKLGFNSDNYHNFDISVSTALYSKNKQSNEISRYLKSLIYGENT